MVISEIKILTNEIISKYGDRKRYGLISFIINMNKKQIFLVPKNKEHLHFVAELIGTSTEEIIKNPKIGEKYIPIHIMFETDFYGNYEINGIIVGSSSLELAGNVLHYKKDLDKAHSMILKMIYKGEVLVGKLKENNVIYRYSYN